VNEEKKVFEGLKSFKKDNNIPFAHPY
jgi:hypothetical protein